MEFVAFHSQHGPAFVRYAQWELGDARVAATVVEDVFTFLLQVWPEAL
ncbi:MULTISPECIES: hypothetical protein [Streptomyces]|nr:hypothetical protein [Streptomyces spororaveus]MCM9077159.1 hypothetical protein [Streptomyces spororaveus]